MGNPALCKHPLARITLDGARSGALANCEPEARHRLRLDGYHEGVRARLRENQVVESERSNQPDIGGLGVVVGGELDRLRQRPGQERAPVGILKLNGEAELVAAPRRGNAKPQPDREGRMASGKTLNPQRVPTSAEDEELAPHRLNRIGEQGDIDGRADRIGGQVHRLRVPVSSQVTLRHV